MTSRNHNCWPRAWNRGYLGLIPAWIVHYGAPFPGTARGGQPPATAVSHRPRWSATDHGDRPPTALPASTRLGTMIKESSHGTTRGSESRSGAQPTAAHKSSAAHPPVQSCTGYTICVARSSLIGNHDCTIGIANNAIMMMMMMIIISFIIAVHHCNCSS